MTEHILVICCALAGLVVARVDAPPVPLPLDGAHRFQIGDDPAWADAGFDDSGWRRIRVPASWPSQGVPFHVRFGWYRMHVTIPAAWRDRPLAVALGVIVSADEVYFNGRHIGGRGRVGRWFAEAGWAERLYDIPPGAIRFDADNVIAIRVLNFWDGGIVTGPLRLGDAAVLRAEYEWCQRPYWITWSAFFTFYSLSCLFALCLWLSGVRDAESLRFGAVLFIYWLNLLLESRWLDDWGWNGHLVERVVLVLACVSPVVVLEFAAVVTQSPASTVGRGLRGLLLVGTLGAALIPSVGLLYYLAAFLLTPAVVGAAALVLYWFAAAWWRGQPLAAIFLLGYGGAFAAHTITFLSVFQMLTLHGVFLYHYGTAFFLLCSMFALAVRYHTALRRLRAASAAVLAAHEEERKRLARDLHDGVVQSLLAIKLNLDMMRASVDHGKSVNKSALDELAAETASSIGELRGVALDLRPPMLEHQRLAELLRSHAEQVGQRTGLEIRLEADDAMDAPPALKDHLYRIFQEGLKNIVKHAEARCVRVRLATLGDRLRLEIADDGRGFDPARVAGHASGLGLTTIRERAELLGGWAKVSSSHRGGTVVLVEVPCGDG